VKRTRLVIAAVICIMAIVIVIVAINRDGSITINSTKAFPVMNLDDVYVVLGLEGRAPAFIRSLENHLVERFHRAGMHFLVRDRPSPGASTDFQRNEIMMNNLRYMLEISWDTTARTPSGSVTETYFLWLYTTTDGMAVWRATVVLNGIEDEEKAAAEFVDKVFGSFQKDGMVKSSGS
jgi:hypothetical protein